ncbi:hypothetical protein LEP1GSC036_0397 [Leptospira weilii str. 2006001853]|uniref:Uncharacterized protein n=2 Tax=Leptospira weilii TaxID=28184 RepID=A0A828Z4A1_9LEPT|nr:hypothetical protein [Leptospira weilii]EKR65214.1 hypothetical protein LEP1GSC036_0397 [Leptospira weilii str. 2006001853]EMN44796.1 hypothetical protein LEP1GSC086_0748 [Leptospira weilii str. LNT 1234]QDK22011.1 molybdate metabolism regulator [Leptospira weilii]QDK25950.1 molybdate metabolism regulator [Leptospira weilii]ULH28144.1 molybdate metabolism regulator [Leptospira weilii]
MNIRKYLINKKLGTFWQQEIFKNLLVTTLGEIGKTRKIDTKTFSNENDLNKEAGALWKERIQEGYEEPTALTDSEESELFQRVQKEPDFHIRIELAESGLSKISEKNRKKILQSLVKDCDCVMMGLGTADEEEYDGEDEGYPGMIQEETGLTPADAREVYNLKFLTYKENIKQI